MERARLVAAVWDWLPAFRAIAETEHLPTAAKRVGVTPPALSRTLKLIEEQLEVELFRRVGRRLELAPEGELLLEGVRDAMRRVHDSLEQLAASPSVGTVRIASVGVLAPVLAQAIVGLADSSPGMRPEVCPIPREQFGAALLDGRLDVAIASSSTAVPGIEVTRLGQAGRAIYCGPTHPARKGGDPREHRFVAPAPGPSGAVDGWPHDTPRDVAVQVADPSLAARLCAEGVGLAVLTDRLAEQHGLVRIAPALPCPVFALRRVRLADGMDRADAVIQSVLDVVA